MPALRRIACIAILCLVFVVSNAEIKTVLEKNLKFPDTQFYFSLENLLYGNSENFDNLTYALCETNEDKTEKTCKVVLETKDQTDQFCNVTLKVSDAEKYKIFKEMKMAQFGPKNIMLLWEEHGETYVNIKANVIDMSSCQNEDLLIRTEAEKFVIRSTSLIAYNDSTIDVVMPCGTAKLCKANINTQAKAVTNTTPWIPATIPDAYVSSVIRRSKSKGYLMYPKGADKYHILYLVKDDGAQKLLKTSEDRLGPSALSTDHETISTVTTISDVPTSGNNKAIVWRFDQEGNLKLDKTLVFSDLLLQADIQNLAEGGFLLLTVECHGDCRQAKDMTYHVTKFAADGNRIGSLEIPGTIDLFSNNRTTPSYGIVRLFQKETKEYCLSFVTGCVACTRGEKGPSHLKVVAKCFSDGDFSV